jgi:hypothetical protein
MLARNSPTPSVASICTVRVVRSLYSWTVTTEPLGRSIVVVGSAPIVLFSFFVSSPILPVPRDDVFWKKDKNRWYAQLKHNGKQIHVGSFARDAKADAEAAIIAKRNEPFTHNDLDRL